MLATANLADATISPEPFPTRPGGIAGRVELPADFPELRLFAMLLWKFDRPNGPLSLLGGRPDGDPDAPFKWDFLFVPTGQLRLQVIRNGGAIELMWWGQAAGANEIVGYLERNLELHRADIESTVRSLESYTLILNPFVRHRNIATLTEAELDKITLVAPGPFVSKGTPEEAEEQVRRQREYMELTERQASLMFLLVTEAAFMAEAFLNLLISFMARKPLRESPALMKETLRQRWRQKVDRLHVDCEGFPNAVDSNEPRLHAASKLFEIRNKVAHSTPHKVDMALGKMWFHRKFPVLERGEPYSKFAIALSNQLPSLAQAKFCKKAADEFVGYLIEVIDPDYREEIRFATSRNPIGFNETKGIYGIVFGDVVALSVSARPVTESGEKEAEGGVSVPPSES